jgi:hypothetical protein
MLPVKARLPSILGLAVGAPICAELLQAYLTGTGDVATMAFTVVVLAGLYGTAALLIRDLAVRTGRSWVGVLLLGAAFGLATTGIIDGSLFGQDRADVSYWDELREPTLVRVPGLGVSVPVYAGASWVLGHVTMSVGAPVAVQFALAPRLRGSALLGKVGTFVALALFALVAVFIHQDGVRIYGAESPGAGMIAIGVVVVALVALALSPVGQDRHGILSRSADDMHVPGGSTVTPSPLPVRGIIGLVAGTVAARAALDFLPPDWFGFGGMVVFVVAVSLLGLRGARHGWDARQVGVIGDSAIVAGILTGFLAPLPPGVSAGAKYGQSALMLLAAIALLGLVIRRGRTERVRDGRSEHRQV